MSQYMITYLGGDHPSDPEVAKQHFKKYMTWIESLGDSALSPANPLKDTHTISADGTISAGSMIGMSGYTIIEAESIEQALAMATACPFLEVGGSLEVSERIEMSM